MRKPPPVTTQSRLDRLRKWCETSEQIDKTRGWGVISGGVNINGVITLGPMDMRFLFDLIDGKTPKP